MGRRSGVRVPSRSSIEIDFYYRGVRCRERLKLKPTPANLKYAERLKGEILNAIERGKFDYAETFPNSKRARTFAKVAGDTITVEEALGAWLTRAEAEVQHSTHGEYKKAVHYYLIPRFGHLRLTELTRSMVKDWVAELSLTRKTICNILRPLRAVLADALDDGYIEQNPLKDWVPRKREALKEEQEIDPFTPEEGAAIIRALPEQSANLAQFGFSTGLRISELIALQWGDVDWQRGTVEVRRAKVRGKIKVPKTKGSRRHVKLLPPALEALERQKRHTYMMGAEVFHNPHTSAPWAHDGVIRKVWTAALRRAKVRYRYPYQMRHTFASMALSAGENPMWVAKMMGHSDWTMIAKIYGKWIPEVDPDAGSKVAQKMGLVNIRLASTDN